MLGQPPGILHRRGRRLDALHGDPVAHRVQHSIDVASDAGAQQLDALRVKGKLGDLLLLMPQLSTNGNFSTSEVAEIGNSLAVTMWWVRI